MKVNLTDKLGLEDKPTIVIGDVELTVDNSATTMLRVMEVVGDAAEVTPAQVVEVSKLLFDAKSNKALEKLSLSFTDYALVIETAMELIAGGAAEGNEETQATTS